MSHPVFNGHAEFKGAGPDFHSGQFFGGKFISAEVVGSGFGNQIGSPEAVSEIFSGQLFVLMAVTGVNFGIEFVSVLIRAVVAFPFPMAWELPNRKRAAFMVRIFQFLCSQLGLFFFSS